MKRKTTLRTHTQLKTSLRQKLVRGVAGMMLAVAAGGIVYFNFFNSTESRANLYEDGQEVQDLNLTSMCSENPSLMRRWRVNNPNEFDVAIEWDVYPYFQTGLLIAHSGENFFYSNTIPGPNTVRIRWQDQNMSWKQKTKASSGEACSPQGCYAAEVVSYLPAKRNDGSSIPAERQVTSRALGAPEGDDALNFVALGFGGEIVLRFASPVANGEGNDIAITETTYGNQNCSRYPERVQAYGSQDGCHFVYLGEGCQDAQFDLGAMSWVKYIKLKDISPVTHSFNNDVADGYDIDGVACLHGSVSVEANDGLVAGSAQEVVQYNRGTRKNGTEIHPSRIDPEKALGIPQNDDLGVNFVSLGFNGSLTLKFDYVVFNNEGADLQVVETSFGAPNCETYPEAAYFEGSLNGINWFPMGEICLDGSLDIGDGVYAIQYIKVTDRSPMSTFPNSADGYDLDGIIVLNESCPDLSSLPGNGGNDDNDDESDDDNDDDNESDDDDNDDSDDDDDDDGNSDRIAFYDNNSVPDEIAEIAVSPNPFRESFKLSYETGSINEKIDIRIYNYVGQVVHQESVNIPKSTRYAHEVNGSKLPRGIYIVSVESAGQKQSLKIIKN